MLTKQYKVNCDLIFDQIFESSCTILKPSILMSCLLQTITIDRISKQEAVAISLLRNGKPDHSACWLAHVS